MEHRPRWVRVAAAVATLALACMPHLALAEPPAFEMDWDPGPPPPVKVPGLDAHALDLGYAHLVVAVSEGVIGEEVVEALPWEALAACATPATLFVPTKAKRRTGVHLSVIAARGDAPILVGSSTPGKPAFKKGCIAKALRTIRLTGSARGEVRVALAVVKLGSPKIRGHRVELTEASGAVSLSDPIARWISFGLEDCLPPDGKRYDRVEIETVGGVVLSMKVPGADKSLDRCLSGRLSATPSKGTPVRTTFTVRTMKVFRMESVAPEDVAAAAVGLPLSGVVTKPGLGAKLEDEHSALGGLVGDEIGEAVGIGTITKGGGEGYDGFGARAATAEVRLGKAEVMGSLDKEIIRRVVRMHLAEVRYCYEKELVRDPTLAGKLEVKFVIAASGVVASGTIESSTVSSGTVGSCLVARVKRWKFPAPAGGGIVLVKYPFVFKSPGLDSAPKKKKKKKTGKGTVSTGR